MCKPQHTIQFFPSTKKETKYLRVKFEKNFNRGFSSVGRASALQAECHRFEPGNLHHFSAKNEFEISNSKFEINPSAELRGNHKFPITNL